VPVSARPLNPEREFYPKPADPTTIQLGRADLLLANGDPAPAVRAAYVALANESKAHEGLGLLALREKRPDEARKEFAAAGDSARTWYERGLLESDLTKSRTALEKAAQENKRWADPCLALARKETGYARKAFWLAQAAQRDPRNATTWRELAEAQLELKQFPESSKSWLAAERASSSEAERQQVRQARLDIEQKRLEYEESERKRIAAEKEAEIQRLKDAAMARIHEAEAKANAANPPRDPNQKVEDWFDTPKPKGAKSVTGTLVRVDCLGSQARLVVQPASGKPMQLLLRDPTQAVIAGGEGKALRCGLQGPVRVTVEYTPGANAKLGTAGNVFSVELMQ
jgi:hypothetical protein